ncbi:metallophosphoesterase family protein [Candidatus Uhrbacteria bacterium]|nr:metallophosphoesterase family protein [Candidatus Uhrbacteria bacterium]
MEGGPLSFVPWWMFDVAIAVMLVVGAVLLWQSVLHLRARKAVFVWSVIGVCASIGLVTVLYGSFIEPTLLTVVERDVSLSASPTHTMRVAIASDYHAGPYKQARYMRRVVDRVNRANVEAVWSIGDYVLYRTDEIEMLYPLKAYNVPHIAVTGNHDHEFGDADGIAKRLEDFGATMLRNRAQTVTSRDGGTLNVVGLDDIWFTADSSIAFAGVDETRPTIALVHNPDFILDADVVRADLVIAAHTHGGQIRLPWLGSVSSLPTKLGRAYDRGFFSLDGNRKLFITQGVGESGPRARLFARPTVDVLTIHF